MSDNKTATTNKSLVDELLKVVNELRFGSIEITVHDGRVTQIERREKVRFDQILAKNSPTAKSSG